MVRACGDIYPCGTVGGQACPMALGWNGACWNTWPGPYVAGDDIGGSGYKAGWPRYARAAIAAW